MTRIDGIRALVLVFLLLPAAAHAGGPDAAPAPEPAAFQAAAAAESVPAAPTPTAEPGAYPPLAEPVSAHAALGIAPGPVEDQPRTLLTAKTARGGFGGLRAAYTRVQGRPGAIFGGRGAFLANHAFAVGLAAYGLVSRFSDRSDVANTPSSSGLAMGYGGLWLEAIVLPMEVVHVSVGALVGAGGVSYGRWNRGTDDNTWNRGSAMFVAEPSVAVELNVASVVRVGLEGSYRFVAGSELAGVSDHDLSGWTVGTMLKFGKF